MIQEAITYIIITVAVGYVCYKIWQMIFMKRKNSGCNCSSNCGVKKELK